MSDKFLQIVRLKTPGLNNRALCGADLEKMAVWHPVDEVNWQEFPYKPKVGFRIGYLDELICLTFHVSEESVRAIETRINGDVYKDSCVEFFISFDDTGYYNFEFNCIGTPHVAFGQGRFNRQPLPESIVNSLGIVSSLGSEPFDTRTGGFEWELNVEIPVSCFIHTPGLELQGAKARANFYKCGDELPVPHFVTWNPVGTPQPDYHRPEFFGIIEFEPRQ